MQFGMNEQPKKINIPFAREFSEKHNPYKEKTKLQHGHLIWKER